MRRAATLLSFIAFLPSIGWAASYQPWRIVIVYPQAQQVRANHRPPPRPMVKQERVCPPVRPQVPVRAPVVQAPAVQEPAVHAHEPWELSSFVSGSAEKPAVNEYELWKQTAEGQKVREKWKRHDQSRHLRQFLVNTLDGELGDSSRAPAKGEPCDETE